MLRTLFPAFRITQLGFVLLGLGALLHFALSYVTSGKLADGANLDVSYLQTGLVAALLVRAGLLVLAWGLLFGDTGHERTDVERATGTLGAVALVLAFAWTVG